MSVTDPTEVDLLREAIQGLESRGSISADLPPLAPGAHAAVAVALRLLSIRARSAQELRERLTAKECGAEDVEEALERLELWGLLDDADFAYEWVRGRRRRRGKAVGALRRELSAKGVAEEHINAAVGQIAPEDERSHAEELVRARRARTHGRASVEDSEQSRQRERRRLVAFLQRRGFPQGLALSVVDAQM